MKIKMLPHVSRLGAATSGIARVVEAYFKHLPFFDVQMVAPDSKDYDLLAVHAGMTGSDCDVLHSHGLYWTADYDSPKWEYDTNRKVIEAGRGAKMITVPSEWVAETYRRDMRINPAVIPHGIDWHEWQVKSPGDQDYVLYNKNRQGDVCDASLVQELAKIFKQTLFLTTVVADKNLTPNVKKTGVVAPGKMKRLVQGAAVYFAPTKETFGIGVLEAMASGVPVLGCDHGGIRDLVQHGVNGYLAAPDDIDDLTEGLNYCLKYREQLGDNGREIARGWTWERACQMVANVYRQALEPSEPTVAIVVPAFQYGHKIEKCLNSAIGQTYDQITDIVVVDDGSDDQGETKRAVEKVVKDAIAAQQKAKELLDKAQDDEIKKAQRKHEKLTAIANNSQKIKYVRQTNQGVAIARNNGIAGVSAKYICCLDADDQIAPRFISTLVPPLEADPLLGIAYSALVLRSAKRDFKGKWPNDSDYDKQVAGANQVPTCCLFRRDAWKRTGGYRQRYAPDGCGTEDAEFWLRIGSIGYSAKKVTDERLFIYNAGGYTTGTRGYKEVNWLQWHPWAYDGHHPFASVATPEFHSHPVRQYDEPMVSIVIPVGPGHELSVLEALDSLEAQTIRRWEVIVVWDSDKPTDYIKDSYPYAKFVEHGESRGAGAARNSGARLARAPYLLFLDADDWLMPRALEYMIEVAGELPYEAIIYSESLGTRAVDEATAEHYKMRNELISYNRGIATVRQVIAEYNHEVAVMQPFTKKPYFWCYISSLLPTHWHSEVGGFNEEMPAWEDWDYWIKLAKKGKPFVGIDEPLMVYSYDSGARREGGREIKDELLEYMKSKHGSIKVMGCKNCDKKRQPKPQRGGSSVYQQPVTATTNRSATMNDQDFVMCKYVRQKRGGHPLTGVTLWRSPIEGVRMRRSGNAWVIDYGYRSQGETFLVHRKDKDAQSMWFQEVAPPQAQRVVKLPKRQPRRVPTPPEPVWEDTGPTQGPHPLAQAEPSMPSVRVFEDGEQLGVVGGPTEFDLQLLPGVTDVIAGKMDELGLDSPSAILEAGVDGLVKIKGVGPAKANMILQALQPQSMPEQSDIIKEIEELLGEPAQ